MSKTNETYHDTTYISRIGYDVRLNHKEVDYAVKDLTNKSLNSITPPNLILLGTKDQD